MTGRALVFGIVAIFAALVRAEDARDVGMPGWLQPPAEQQLEMDPELIPVGRGAVFVPAMTDPAGEPPYVITDLDGKVLARTPMGRKTTLTQGTYLVLVGSGVESQMMPHRLEVYEGHCALVQPDWAGLLVHVVDRQGMEFRGSYEIFSLPEGEGYGLGLGADPTRGESLRTWLLPPGRYMIVKAGETIRARTDFVTVRLEPGELVHFTLVMDETGAFLGGGVVDRGEGKTEIKNWRLGLVLGGDLSWNRADNVVGRQFGNTVTLNAFLDWSLRYIDPRHLVYLRLQVDEGQSVQPGQNFFEWRQKTYDELDTNGIYILRLLPWLGPYVRFGLETNLFPGWYTFERTSPELEKDLVLLDENGNVQERRPPPPSDERWELRLADSFDPLELREGAGLSFDLTPWQVLDLHLRTGLGARQYFVSSLLQKREYRSTDADQTCLEANCFQKVPSTMMLGWEAGLVGSARLSRWLMIDSELDTLVPFTTSRGGRDPAVNWKNTISLRLVSFASLAYVTRLDYDRALSDKLQFEQRILLRFTFDVL